MPTYLTKSDAIEAQLNYAAASIGRRTVALRKVLPDGHAYQALVKVTRKGKTVIINDIIRDRRIKRLNRRARSSK